MIQNLYQHNPEMLNLQLINVNRKKNYLYAAVTSPTKGWCANRSYDLRDFEKKLRMTLEDGYHEFTALLISPSLERNLKEGN